MVKIGSVLDAVPDIADADGARPVPRLDGRLDVDAVSFAYGRDDVLLDVEIHVPAGGCIALVGASGGGKSTLAKLIARFYDPRAGSIRVDGTDLRELELRGYRRQLGVVLQDPFLFAGTIADNIRFARPDATDEQVQETARLVGVARLAERFPDRLAHRVREGGAGLSAGERQLISIARALLADPRILILDEATSSIDRPTERLVEQALDRLLHGRTSIVIAHRLATVRRADEILVVERGRVVERGSERDLLDRGGAFHRLAQAGLAV
jgi:ATP-binding cassette subfamily B protein